MKKLTPKFCLSTLGKVGMALLALSAISVQAQDIVYVTSYVGTAQNVWPPIQIISGVSGFGSTEITTAQGVPSRTRTWYGNASGASWKIQPTLSVAGGTYKIYTAHNTGTAPATSCSTNVLVTLTTTDGTLSPDCANTTAFQRSKGGPVWNLIGYITNNPGMTTPTITFTHSGGQVDGSPNRLYVDAFKFEELNPCTTPVVVAPPVTVGGPLAANQSYVTVLGVDAGATNITVYADGGVWGTKTSGIVAGANQVSCFNLYYGGEIKATQTKNGCTSALPSNGPLVGGGPNPQVKAFLGCYYLTNRVGDIGTPAPTASLPNWNYTIKGDALMGGSQTAPRGGEVLIPGQCWQTVTFSHALDKAVRQDDGGTPAISNYTACALESLIFAIDTSVADSGPYDIYVDQIMNGDILIEDFETYTVGTTNRFNTPRAASYPNPTATYLTNAPNSALISSNYAFSGTNALRIQWQWNDISNIRWVKVQCNATTGKNYPQMDPTKPITVRYLVLPVGQNTADMRFPIAPQPQTKRTNETVTFTVQPSGIPAFTYQWQFAGTDIPNATTSSYTKSNLQVADAGAYSVLVTGGTGCSATLAANLKIITEIPPSTNIVYSWVKPNLTLTWGQGVLQSETNIVNPNQFTDVPGATSPYVINTSTSGVTKFYRLRGQ